MNGTFGSFSDISVGCHSAGCEFHMHIALNRTEDVKVSFNAYEGAFTQNKISKIMHKKPPFARTVGISLYDFSGFRALGFRAFIFGSFSLRERGLKT